MTQAVRIVDSLAAAARFLLPGREARLLWFLLLGWVCIGACTGPKQDRAAAIPSFELMEGFQIELIASEPLVADPVDMEIDEYGRMYVVEMHGYPLDLSGSGKVKLLEDTDGDGVMDKSTVFADSLILPTGIMRWKQGVLVTDPPHVWYLEDNNGDGIADIKEIILTGFARSNPQHNVNSPRIGLDNWIYLGHEPAVTTNLYQDLLGDKGTEVYFASNQDGVRLPVNASGRGVRFKPDAQLLELLSSRTQFGHTWDARGNRFLVNNNNHVIHEVLRAEYLGRNPFYPVSSTTQSVSDHGDAAEVYSVTDNPEHQLLTDVGVITSACGPLIYLGGAFPDEVEGVFFVNEPVSNLIHADRLQPNGASFKAGRLLENKEFLASKDAWFRPVNLYVGPDGALYVVDYYRQIIEHPEWMAEDVVNSGALYNGTDQGRIYRITPTGTGKAEWGSVNLGDAVGTDLVAFLGHTNSWWRKNAQRLLIDRADSQSVPALVAMAVNEGSELGRLHALWTLEGLGLLTDDLITQGMASVHASVRMNAVRLAEPRLSENEALKSSLYTLVNDPDAQVRFQLLNTLGQTGGATVASMRQRLLMNDLEDEWVQIAALSADFEQVSALLPHLIDTFDPERPAMASLIRKLGRMVGTQGDRVAVGGFVDQSLLLPSKPWQGHLLAGLNDGLRDRLGEKGITHGRARALVAGIFDHPELQVKAAAVEMLEKVGVAGDILREADINKAKKQAQNQELSGEERALYLRLSGVEPRSGFSDDFLRWLGGTEPLPVQRAILQLVAKDTDKDLPGVLFSRWPSFTPELRETSLSLLMAKKENVIRLLDALEEGVVHPSHLGWPRTVQLMNQQDLTLKARARQILTRHEKEREEVLAAYAESLSLEGSEVQGASVYEKHCAVCHQMGKDRGLAFGPDLASLRNRRKENILSDILDPNLSIADNYDLWQVEMQDGDRMQGLIVSETPTAIALLQAGGREVTLARNDIKQLQTLNVSAMPQGLEAGISIQEMADLLAFIKRGS